MVEIKAPIISTEGKVGYVVRWYKDDGDEVEEGEEVAEVMIEKTTLHIQAPQAGKLKIVKEANEEIREGEIIGYIE